MAIDWFLFGLLICFGLIMTVVAIIMQRREYEHKKSINYPFVQGDFKCTTKNALMLPMYALGYGFLAATTGAGSGAFYNTLLLSLEMHP